MENNNFLLNMSQDEFFEKLKETLAEALFAPEPNEGVKVKKHYVYGIAGICDLFWCSPTTAIGPTQFSGMKMLKVLKDRENTLPEQVFLEDVIDKPYVHLV